MRYLNMRTIAGTPPARRTSSRVAVCLAAGLATVLVLDACSSSAKNTGTGSGAGTSTISVGLPGGSSQAHFWDYMVADDLGLFAKNHLNVKVVDTKDAATTGQAVTAGRVDIGETASDSFIQAMDKGANITIVGQGSGSPEAIVANKDVANYEQLKGKKFATISTTSGTGLVVLKILKAHGYPDPLHAVNWVISGSTPARLAALQSGAVEATLLSPPSLFKAVSGGAHILSYATTDVPVPEVYYAAYKPYAAKNSEQIVNFLTAMQQAAHWLNDPANKDQAIQILMKYSSGSSQATAEQTYDESITQLHSFGPGVVPGPTGIKADLDLLGKDTSTYAKYVDTSYAEKAVAAAGPASSK